MQIILWYLSKFLFVVSVDSHMRKISCVLYFRKEMVLDYYSLYQGRTNFMCQTIPKSQWPNTVEVHFFACLQFNTHLRESAMCSHMGPGSIHLEVPSLARAPVSSCWSWWKWNRGFHRRLCAQAWRQSTPILLAKTSHGMWLCAQQSWEMYLWALSLLFRDR